MGVVVVGCPLSSINMVHEFDVLAADPDRRSRGSWHQLWWRTYARYRPVTNPPNFHRRTPIERIVALSLLPCYSQYSSYIAIMFHLLWCVAILTIESFSKDTSSTSNPDFRVGNHETSNSWVEASQLFQPVNQWSTKRLLLIRCVTIRAAHLNEWGPSIFKYCILDLWNSQISLSHNQCYGIKTK